MYIVYLVECRCVLDTDSYKSPLVRKVGMPKPNKELSTSLPKQITAKILQQSEQQKILAPSLIEI